MRAVADLCRRYGPESRATGADRMPPSPLAALQAIAQCRTQALGGPLSPGTACGELASREHACKHRHGPTCHKAGAARGLAPPRARLLPVPYCLVTLTRPAARRCVARSHPQGLDTVLVHTAAAALQALALAPKDLGGQRGVVGVLHPWTREMASPPPVHDLVPGGALSPDGATGRSPRDAEWRVPVHARSTRFRGKCKAALTTAGLLVPVPPQVWPKGWGTPCQPAGTGPAVLASCAPARRRGAMTNNRLVPLADGHVTCRVKARTRPAWRPRRLSAAALMRRFLQHGLPKRCRTVRSYGILSPRRRPVLAPSRDLWAACPSHAQATPSGPTRDRHATAPTPEAALPCRRCGGQRVWRCRLVPQKRRPPS
jgi:Putative transposase/Transposase zinc-binding domain